MLLSTPSLPRFCRTGQIIEYPCLSHHIASNKQAQKPNPIIFCWAHSMPPPVSIISKVAVDESARTKQFCPVKGFGGS